MLLECQLPFARVRELLQRAAANDSSPLFGAGVEDLADTTLTITHCVGGSADAVVDHAQASLASNGDDKTSSSSPAMEEGDAWEVERIVGKRFNGGVAEWRVRWRGYESRCVVLSSTCLHRSGIRHGRIEFLLFE